MKILIRSVTLGLFLYTIHASLVLIKLPFYGQQKEYYFSVLGSFIYGLIVVLWGYVLTSGIYIRWVRKDKHRKWRYIKGAIVVLIGYFLSSIPLDFNFSNNLIWKLIISFIPLIPILVEVEYWSRERWIKAFNKH